MEGKEKREQEKLVLCRIVFGNKGPVKKPGEVG
jgi:hypothetical protein